MPQQKNNNEQNIDLKESDNQSYPDELFDLNNSIDLEEDTSSVSQPKLSFKQKLKEFIKDLWRNKTKRRVLISCISLLLVGLIVFPSSRYFILNSVGVRSSASVTVLDQSTSQPLKNVAVNLANQETTTNEKGIAKLHNLKLGSTKLKIKKRAFAEVNKSVTLGWGSNPLGESKIEPVGMQFAFSVKDFLADNPIEKAEAVSGEYSAFSDKNGKVVLTIDPEDAGDENLNITLKAEHYRDEKIEQLPDNKQTIVVKMAPAKSHFFVSKRSGKYDVYRIDADGKNEQLVLSGTGNEREDMTLSVHPNKNFAALVSTRQNERNKDGFLKSTLTLLTIDDEEVSTNSLTTSERIQIIGWSNEQLVYVKIRDGASAATPDRHKLLTYNIETEETKELAKANYFNDVLMINDDIYFAPSPAYQGSKGGLFKISAKGENQKTIFDQEVWNIFRTSYDKLSFSVQKDWYEYKLKDAQVLAAAGAPPNQATRVYIDSPDKKNSLWVDQRDGKGVLVVYELESGEEKATKSQSGLNYPIRWLNNKTIIYRISNGQETADYVINLDGGEPRKIIDVTNTGGVDRWYYY